MLNLYKTLSSFSRPLLRHWLQTRLGNGKEVEERLDERMGKPGHQRPEGRLIWLHAASVGEAQSVLILIKTLKERFPEAQFLITTGTVTSARLMQEKLPPWTIHQFYPLDHPEWVKAFLDHWHPDLIIWTESELWPNMLLEIGERHIPVALVNARISSESFKKWRIFPLTVKKLLSVFDIILAQTEEDARMIRTLGGRNVIVTDTLKYCAEPLTLDQNKFALFSNALANRIGWMFASTHAGEEEIACTIHKALKAKYPNLLTIIAPRHPDRREEIKKLFDLRNLSATFLSEKQNPPHDDNDIFVVDTIGNLGLFYKLCGLACIGRSFSHDGGGGHNPIEAIQMGCVTLHGPRVHNFMRVYRDMDVEGVSIPCGDEKDLQDNLESLIDAPEKIFALQDAGIAFLKRKSGIINLVMNELEPLFIQAGLNCAPAIPRNLGSVAWA